jgi:hypothetical protein
MPMNAKNLLRWFAIVALGGHGIYTLIITILNASRKPDGDWALFWLFFLPFALAYSGVFIAFAVLILRRQYRQLCTLISGIAAVIVFTLLFSLSDDLGLREPLRDWFEEPLLGTIIFLVLTAISIAVAFMAARWTYRRGRAFSLRFGPAGSPSNPANQRSPVSGSL